MKRARGFSLLEILVAFTVLALSLGVLMQIFSGSLRNAEVTRDRAQAAALAQSLLDGAGAESPLAAGGRSGTSDRFRWQLETAPFDEGPRPGVPENLRPAVPPLELWQVTARVSWGGEGREPERLMAISTLRAQKPLVQP